MKILRSFCQTPAATESFEQFEYLIRKKHTENIRKSDTSPSSSIADVDNKEKIICDPRSIVALDDTKFNGWMLSRTLPQGIFRKASSSQPQPKLVKSITIENFCNPQFYPGSDISLETTEEAHNSMQHSVSTMTLSSHDCKPSHRTLPRTKDRLPMRTSSNDRLNTEASSNFSHQHIKQTVAHVEDGHLLNPVSTKSSDASILSVTENVAADSSRRIGKSESIKQLVEYSIKEMKRMGKWRVTSEAAEEINEL